MLFPAAGLVLQAAMLVGSAPTYEQAYQETQANGRPLLVLVGADWCPGCRTMKHGVLSQMRQAGGLSDVNYAEVDADAGDVARRLMRGGTIPQLIVFTRDGEGKWHREQVTGATSQRGVQQLIRGALVHRVQPQRSSDSAIGN